MPQENKDHGLLISPEGEILLNGHNRSTYNSYITRFIKSDRSVLEQVARIVKATVNKQKYSDMCHFSNEVGAEMSTASLPNIASECYELSFVVQRKTDPYHTNCPVYAGNFVNALYKSRGRMESLMTADEQNWLVSKSVVLSQALFCLGHFLEWAYFRDGYSHFMQEHENQFTWFYAQYQQDAANCAGKTSLGISLQEEISKLISQQSQPG